MKTHSILWALLILIMIAPFQNCTKHAFMIDQNSSSSLGSAILDTNGGINPDDPWFKGETAWNKARSGGSCFTCHGSIDDTDKRNMNAQKITDAIKNVAQMKSIVFSGDEMNQIIYSLNSPRPTALANNNQYKFTCDNEDTRGVSHKTGRRLSLIELKNTLSDLFGSTIYNNSAVTAELAMLPEDYNEKSEQFIPTISAGLFDPMLNVAYKLGEVAAANTSFVNKFAGCSQLNSSTCVRNFVTKFGARALRKPLSTSDVDALVSAYTADPTTVDGVTLITAILLRVDFLYHYELGTDSGNRIKLNPYEVASRLSYMLTSSIPDDTLWTAASQNQLTDLNQIRPHAERLLDSTRGRDKVKAFFREWMGVKANPQLAQTTNFVNGMNLSTFYSDAVSEFNQFVEYIIWTQKGNLTSLFTDYTVFPKTQDLAKVYGTSVWSSGNGLSSMNGHRGIFLRPASLIYGSNITPLIRRGVRVRKDILCQPLGAPTVDVVMARGQGVSEDEISHVLNSNRNVVKNMTQSPVCMSCHTQINPVGFALENFDSLGRKQTIEKVYDTNDVLVASHPVDTFSANPLIEPNGQNQVTDSADLNLQLLGSNSLKSCMAEKITRFTYMRTIASEDNCVLADKEKIIRNTSQPIRESLIQNVLNEDLFWKGKE